MADSIYDQTEPQLRRLERRDTHLRRMTTILVVLLGLTVVSLYLPQIWGTSVQWLPAPETHETLAVGVFGLAIIFYLYVTHRLRELSAVRRDLLGTRLREEQLRGRLSELSSLFETTARASSQIDQTQMLELIVRRVLFCLEADQSSIMLLDENSDTLVTRAVAGVDEEFVREARVKVGEGVSGWVAEHNEPLVLDDFEMATRFPEQFNRGRDIASALCVPLSTGSDVVGVLNINRLERNRPFGAMDARLLQIFCAHIASAIRRIEQVSHLDQEKLDLTASNQHLAKLNRMKEVFLSAAKHEMRTPLTAILASSDLLKRDGTDIEPDRHEKLVLTIHEQASHLRDLVNEILELSRLEGGSLRLEREPQPLNDLIAEALRATEGQAARRGIRLQEDLEDNIPAILLDGLKIRQVVINLIANAIKFSSPGGIVEIISRTHDNEAIVEVRDKGIGIRAEDTETIFQLFTRSEQAVGQSIEGLGLGLYLVKRYVELHEGRVWLESTHGKGSRFYFALPIPRDDRESLEPGEDIENESQSARAA